MKGGRALLGAWGLTAALVTLRSFRGGQGAPAPSQFLALDFAFSLLGALALVAPEIAVAFGGGIVLLVALQDAGMFAGIRFPSAVSKATDGTTDGTPPVAGTIGQGLGTSALDLFGPNAQAGVNAAEKAATGTAPAAPQRGGTRLISY